MASLSSSAAGASDDPWDPWGCVALGKTDEQGKTSKAHLQTQFTVTRSGGLKCNTCSFHVEKKVLIDRTAAGVSGILTNHLISKDHKVAVGGKENKAATKGMHAFFSPKPKGKPAAASQGGAAGGAAAPSLPTPFIPHTSGGEEDDADAVAAADSVIGNFLSLSVPAKASVAQRMTKLVERCKGFRPPSLDGIVDLLNHVPPAFFYTAGSYGSTNLDRVARKCQLRQHNFHATGCLEFADSGSSTCAPCRAVSGSGIDGHMPYLNQPAITIPAKTNDAHYSPYQMKEKKDAAREEDRRQRLQLLTLKRRVHRQERALGLHERLMVALTSGSARKLQTVLARAHQQGLGVAAVLKVVTKCLEGVYQPRSHFTDVEMGIASLMYIFGGTAGAYAANKGLGLPCKRLIQKTSQWSAFVPILFTGPSNYAADIKKAVLANLHANFGQPILERQLEWQQCFGGQWMLALDGTANDKTLSFHSQTGTVVGGCEHKPDDINLALTTEDDGMALLEAVKCGKDDDKSSGAMHLAGETVVICFTPIGATGDAPFLPAAAVPTCNKRSCLRMSQELLTGALDGFDALRERLRQGGSLAGLGDVVTIATDGDAKRRRALTALCNSQENKVPAVELLRDLNLFDTYGGKLRVTVDFDMRHMIKRLRVRLVFTIKGMHLSPLGLKFDRDKIENVFKEYSVRSLASVFDNTDKQNVPAAVDLLRGFRWVADAQAHEVPSQKSADIKLLAALGDHLLRPMIGGVDGAGTKVSLEDALVSSATAAHLLFVIFSEMGSAFIPPQLYHDLQSSAKNLYVVVARQLEKDDSADLLFFLVGTDELEKLFSTLRRLSPGLTFNVLQLLERVGAAARVQTIYAKYPDLDPGSRRLDGSKDKVNAASWRGNLKLRGKEMLQSCWQKGRRQARELLELHYHYGAKKTVNGVVMTHAALILQEAKDKGWSMMRPKGKLVGVSVDVGGDLEGEEVEEEGIEGPAAWPREGEEAGADEAWAADVGASLEDMEEELHAEMEQDHLQAFQTLAGGVAGTVLQAAAATAHVAAERKLYFDLPGGKKHKARWLREAIGSSGGLGTTRGSADRVSRYQGMEKGGMRGDRGAGGRGRRKVVATEIDEPLVEVGDPVVFAVLKDRERETDRSLGMVTIKGVLGVGVGEIVSLENKEQGGGRLPFLREDLFLAGDTTVQVRPIQVAPVTAVEEEGEEGAVAVLELRLEEYTTREPFTFRGGRLVGLLKPQVVQKVDGGTQLVYQIDTSHLQERLALLAEEVRLLVNDGPHGVEGLPVERQAAVPQAGTVDVFLGKEKDEKTVRCEPCQRGLQVSEMERADLRLHAAGHLFLRAVSSSKSLCGFCGLELAQSRCSVDVKDGKLLSTCSFKLARFKYRVYAEERERDLRQRLAMEGESEVAAATKLRLGLGGSKAGKAVVRNIPIPCPMPGCNSVIWKLNLIPHLLEGDHPLPMPGRAQHWLRRGRAVLKELQEVLTTSQRAHKTYALGEGVLQQVATKLEEVRDLLNMVGRDVSITVSFCLEEVVRESQPALAKHHATRGPFKERAPRKDKGKKKGEGKDKGEGEGGGDEGGSGAVAEALGESNEGSEDEEEGEGEGEGEGERGAAGGQSNGKRPADGMGADSAGKKPKKST